MRMRESSQVALQEKYRRLVQSNMDTYQANVSYFLQWAANNEAVRSILATIKRSEVHLDPVAWWEANPGVRRRINWPSTEIGRAKVVLYLLEQVQTGDALQIVHRFSHETRFDDMIGDFNTYIVEPLFEFIQERLRNTNDMLYLLHRYRNQVVWFEQPRLWEAYQNNTHQGEKILDQHFRKFLFENGVEYPFSQPASPSGKADIVAFVEEEQPIPCEVKVFDGDSRGPAYIKRGYLQARRYAEDYGEPEAYLVVFNASDRILDFKTEDAAAVWPLRKSDGGITVYMVTVQIAPRPSASRSQIKPPTRIEFD